MRWDIFQIEEMEVRCEGEYFRGTSDNFDSNQMQWYPGDPEMLEDFSVYLVKNNNGKLEKLDITDWLTAAQIKKLEEQFIEMCRQKDEE